LPYHSCNILALVGGGKNPRYPLNKVMIWDDHQNKCIGELTFRSQVRAVKLRRDRVVVVLDHKIYVYNFADLNLVAQIDTISNPLGLCCVCPDNENNVLVCPSQDRGTLRVELYDKKETIFIPAHKNDMSCIALNADGSRLATASKEGTLIRVWDTRTGVQLQELRRGMNAAEIYSIAFNDTSRWLAVSSDKNTIHVFSLESKADGSTAAPPPDEKKNPRSAFSMFSSILPTTYFASQWSFVQFRSPSSRTIVAFGQDTPQGHHTLIVVAADGSFYKVSFDPATPNVEAVQELTVQFIQTPTVPSIES
jgi:WD40 repeat protein